MPKIEARKSSIKLDGKKVDCKRDERGWSIKSLLRGAGMGPKEVETPIKSGKKRGRPKKKK